MIEMIEGGGVTSAKGFLAGATHAGIKTTGEEPLDLAILVSELPATAAAPRARTGARGTATAVIKNPSRRCSRKSWDVPTPLLLSIAES